MRLEERNILVSVIVPIYNVQDYIARCIESILDQSYTHFELLLINDGTKDASRDICLKYAERDPRIRIIDKENGGLSDARNKGIDEATGDYYVFIDGDDYIKRDYISLLLENIVASNADVTLCSFDVVDDGGNVLKSERLTEKSGVISGRDVLSEVMTDYGYKYVVAWNKIYSKKVFNFVRFDKGKIYEDEYINFRLFWDCKRVGIVEEPLYCYVQRGGSITQSSMSPEKIKVKQEMHKRRISFYQQKEDKEFHSRACQMYCNWLVECTRCYSDILTRDFKNILQKEIRAYAQYAIKAPNICLKLKIQDVLGIVSLSAAAKLKSIYKAKNK